MWVKNAFFLYFSFFRFKDSCLRFLHHRYCVFKKFRRTTMWNSCILPLLKWVGVRRQSSRIATIVHFKTNIFVYIVQVTPVCTSVAQEPKQTAAPFVIAAVALLELAPLNWSSSGRKRSCWTVTMWALFYCFAHWWLKERRSKRVDRRCAWPTPTCSSTHAGETSSWLS